MGAISAGELAPVDTQCLLAAGIDGEPGNLQGQLTVFLFVSLPPFFFPVMIWQLSLFPLRA